MNTKYVHRILATLSGYNCALVVVHMFHTQTISGAYLVWNLILAAIPFYLAWYISTARNFSAIAQNVLLLVWLLFLPNAPYIITDIVHLPQHTSSEPWLNIIVLFSFALNGLLYGIFSILILKKQFLPETIKPLVGTSVLLVISAISAFGVYIGRFLRWNSWSVLTHPLDLATESAQHLTYIDTWTFICAMGAVVFLSTSLLDGFTKQSLLK
jgi:uncharacterized membrane protein